MQKWEGIDQIEEILQNRYFKEPIASTLQLTTLTNNHMSTDYISKIENHINQLDVAYEKSILSNGEILYSFKDLTAGIIAIKVILQDKLPIGFSIRCLYKEMKELEQNCVLTDSLFDIQIRNYVIIDEDTMRPMIVAVIEQ